jgi:hypothetical protein
VPNYTVYHKPTGTIFRHYNSLIDAEDGLRFVENLPHLTESERKNWQVCVGMSKHFNPQTELEKKLCQKS